MGSMACSTRRVRSMQRGRPKRIIALKTSQSRLTLDRGMHRTNNKTNTQKKKLSPTRAMKKTKLPLRKFHSSKKPQKLRSILHKNHSEC